jgi:hypothetical protein
METRVVEDVGELRAVEGRLDVEQKAISPRADLESARYRFGRPSRSSEQASPRDDRPGAISPGGAEVGKVDFNWRAAAAAPG